MWKEQLIQTVKPLSNLALLVGNNAHGRGRRLMSTLLRQAQQTAIHVLPQVCFHPHAIIIFASS